MKKRCSVMMICEDSTTRESAERFWTGLSDRFADCFEFRETWFELCELSRQAQRRKAAQDVAEADVIVFSLKDQPMSQAVVLWLEAALAKRNEKEGYLALLSDIRHCRNELVLRKLAHNAGMDFITELPPTLESGLPEYPEHYSARAHEQSELMSEILRPAPRSLSRLTRL